MPTPRELLHSIFGFSDFRPGQEEIVEAVRQGQNTLAIMPTGGGKSLCYQLPALSREGVTLVVSPLIALMRDQVRSLREAGVEAGALTSGNTEAETDEVFRRSTRAGSSSSTWRPSGSPRPGPSRSCAGWGGAHRGGRGPLREPVGP